MNHTCISQTHRLTTACRRLAIGLAVPALWASGAQAQTNPPDHLVGLLGGAVYATQSVVVSKSNSIAPLPYALLDYGRFFARVETLGVKTVPLAYGHLELVARVSLEGFNVDTAELRGINDRGNPWPVGIGTFQETPLGAVMLNAFYDTTSGGSLLESVYIGKFKLGSVPLYPELGLEWRSVKYVNHLYGVSAAEAQASAFSAYSAGASTMPWLGIATKIPLADQWVLSMQWRYKWLDDAIRNSPLVNVKTQNHAYIAVSYEFK